jgi:hypothetical protein
MMKVWTIACLLVLSTSSFAEGKGRGKGYEVRKAACSGKAANEVCTFAGKSGESRTGKCLESKRESSVMVCKGPRGERGNRESRSSEQ